MFNNPFASVFQSFQSAQQQANAQFAAASRQSTANLPPYRATLRIYPVVMANKSQLECGDKIILPTSSLSQLAQRQVQYPMQFKITNKSLESKHQPSPVKNFCHVGVMEFSAEEGICYCPFWIMQQLLIESGSLIELENVSLPKGNFVQFQPHHTTFTQLTNPRAVLERALRNFSCLTEGDTISIQHGDDNFLLNILQVKPSPAISIIETDVNVDFEAPLDYKEDDHKVSHPIGQSLNHDSKKAEEIEKGDFVFHAPHGQTTSSTAANNSKQSISSNNVAFPSNPRESYFSRLGKGNTISSKRKSSTSSLSQSNVAGGTHSPLMTHSPVSLTRQPTISNSIINKISELDQQPFVLAPASQVTEIKGQWAYIYNVDSKGNKKLYKRITKQEHESNKRFSIK